MTVKKRGERVEINDGRTGVILGTWLKTPVGVPNSRRGTVYRRVRLDDGQIVYRTENELTGAK